MPCSCAYSTDAASRRSRSSEDTAPNVPGGTSADPEHRIPGRDRGDGLVGRIGADALEELADLPLPLAQVRAEDLDLVGVGHLVERERLDPTANPQLTGPGGAQVAHPLGLASRSDEVAGAVVVEQVDDGGPDDAALAAAHPQLARAPHAEAEAR